MTANKINLIDGGIQHSNLFLHMPLFDEIYYHGYADGKVRRYRACREDQPCQVLVLNVIRQSEKVIWEALEDMLKRSVADAAVGVHGVYVFDLLTMDIHKELKTYNHNELAVTLLKHSQKCTPGQTRLVKYSSVYGLLQKMIHEAWGKITFKNSVEVFKDKPSYLDLLVKQLIKNFEFSHEPVILLLNDLSQEPIFDALDALQQERIQKLMGRQFAKAIDFPPEVYVQDRNGVRELLSGSVLRG